MLVNVNIAMRQTIVSTWEAADLPSAGQQSMTHSQFDTSVNLHVSSDVPVTKKYADELTGNQSLDLTALADPEWGTIDGTGLKVQGILVNNLSASATLTISDGGANPYSLNATANLVVKPGASLQMYFADQLADIAAGAKAIDFAITAGQSYQVSIVMG